MERLGMSYPLKKFKDGTGLCAIDAEFLNTLVTFLNEIEIQTDSGTETAYAEHKVDGKVVLHVPATSTGSGLPSNANSSKYMGVYLSADNATATDDPTLWTVDWLRAHA